MSKEQVYEVVKTAIMEILPDVHSEQISIEKSLIELGANSIDRADVVIMSMEELGLKIPLKSLAHARNIEELVDILTANINETK